MVAAVAFQIMAPLPEFRDIDVDVTLRSFIGMDAQFMLSLSLTGIEGLFPLHGTPQEVTALPDIDIRFGSDDPQHLGIAGDITNLLTEWQENHTPLSLIGAPHSGFLFLVENDDRWIPIPRL